MNIEELSKQLFIKYEGGDLTYENHESDNCILDCKTASQFLNFIEDNNLIYLGVTDQYNYRKRKGELALVMKDGNDNVFWIHIDEDQLRVWLYREFNDEYSWKEANRLYDKWMENK